ncbi:MULTISPECIES: MaoC/PaaZ C-terminal domain-containing protein [unclassified Bradyrhizobium]|uniref:MaoC/PaaZ C-terminal domain-containing protein n=1 Tax=unclassified Bradyrhizobium TaxID=2631580 RepID=UPI001CD24EB5|nr:MULTISPECIES: MaoC/PaaZ C-terminal domain-containing protein [unclassified Bradyrhizobium]
MDGRKVKLSHYQPDGLQGGANGHLVFRGGGGWQTAYGWPLPGHKEQIIEFAQKFDPLPIHTNEEIAARSIFSGLIASSAHTFAILISLLSRTQPYSLRIVLGLGWDELRLPAKIRS